jgi:hypothetical protein
MTRLPKLIAVLLALILSASGGVASLAATCAHMASTPAASAHARHDCCHAAHAHAHTTKHDGMSRHAAHDTADAPTMDDRAGATLEEDCAAGHEQNTPQVAASRDDGSPCTVCRMERAAVQPRALATPGTQKIERVADSRAAHAPHSFLLSAPPHTAFAPTQHAPPGASARRHMLIGILLI